MKKGVLKIAFRNIKNNKMYFLFTVILLVLCFSLFSICEFLFVRPVYNRYVAEKVLAKGTENTGLIRLRDTTAEQEINFRLEAIDMNLVHSIGAFDVALNDWECFDELIKIQGGKSEALKARQPDLYENFEEDILGCIYADSTVIPLCDLKLQSGSMLNKDNFDYEDQNLIALYLGDSFSEIPVGTEYKCEFKEIGMVLTIRVMGIIEKGEEWLDASIGSLQGEILKSSYNLDNEVIMAFNDSVYNGMMFYTLNDNADMKDTQKKLYDLAEKHNMDVTIGGVASRFAATETQYKSFREILFALMIFITAISTMIIICFNTVSVLSRKKQYGVFLSGGISKASLFFSLFIEQGVKVILGLLLSGVFIYWGTPTYFELEEIDVVYDIFLNFVLWKTAIFCVAECAIVSVASILILGHYKPVQLIKYHN